MTTYNEYISQFPLKEREEKLDGYEYHHVIPKCVQEKEGISDRSGVLLLPSQHFYAHVLYDIENKTETAKYMLTKANLKLEDIKCYEDCLIFDQIASDNKKYNSEWTANNKNRKKTNKQDIVNDYITGMSTVDIHEKYNVSRSYVYSVLQREGVPCKSKAPHIKEIMETKDNYIKELEEEIETLKKEKNRLNQIIDKLLNS